MKNGHRLLMVLACFTGICALWLTFATASRTALATPEKLYASTLYVAVEGVDTSDCTQPITPCQTIQYAVNQAPVGSLIKVSTGIYSDVTPYSAPSGYQGSETITQVLYLTKTLTIQGGYAYTNAFASPPDATLYPVAMDAISQGRTIFAVDVVGAVIENFHISGGDADGLGGYNNYDAGGGLFAMTSTLLLEACEIHANFGGNTGNANRSYGGGAFLWHSPITLHLTHVTSNTLPDDGQGGGIYAFYSDFQAYGCTVSANTALDGGGLYLFDSNAVTFEDGLIHSNITSLGNGAGVYMDNSDASILNNTIQGNRAKDDGGGLFLLDSSATILANLIISNSAESSGGAIVIHNSDIDVINSVFMNNKAIDSASTILIEGSDVDLYHNTITDWRRAAAIVIGDRLNGSPSNVVMRNMIFESNPLILNQKAAVSIDTGNTLDLSNVIWHNVAITVTPATGTGILIQNEFTVDPAFQADGFHIKLESPARNTGIDVGVSTDFDDEARNNPPDIGADELVSNEPFIYTYLPLALKQ